MRPWLLSSALRKQDGWFTSVIPALRGLRQEDQEFMVILPIHIVNSSPKIKEGQPGGGGACF